MSFNIDRFKANIEQDGYLRNNNYAVYVSPPPILRDFSIEVTDSMYFRIDDFTLPGVTLNLDELPRYGIGPNQRQPVSATFSPFSMQIICDKYGEIWYFWHEWLRRIFEFSGTSQQNTNTIPSYGVEYKDQYSSNMSVMIFDPFGAPVKRVELTMAFPIKINDIPLTWESTNELLKLNIAMTYTDYILIDGET